MKKITNKPTHPLTEAGREIGRLLDASRKQSNRAIAKGVRAGREFMRGIGKGK